MRFPGIRLVSQLNVNVCRFESVLKKRVTNSRALLLIKAQTKNYQCYKHLEFTIDVVFEHVFGRHNV